MGCPRNGVNELIRKVSAKWKAEGTYRDDITCIIYTLNDFQTLIENR